MKEFRPCPHCLGTGKILPAQKPEFVEFPSGFLQIAQCVPAPQLLHYGTTGIYTAAPLLKLESVKLSKNFNLMQFASPNLHAYRYNFVRVSPLLVQTLEKIQDSLHMGSIEILSAYRPPELNRAKGGVSNSTHIDGLAADIELIPRAYPIDDFWKVCDEVVGDTGGVGMYRTQRFVHIDVRGYKSRWEG